MFSEDEWIYERQRLYQLVEAHPDWSMRGYARSLQHDLGWVRKWVKRFRERTCRGLELFRSQPRTPHHCPRRTSEALKNQICEWRQKLSERFCRAAGAKTIQYFLKPIRGASPCASTIYKALHERQYLQPRRRVVPQPLELPEVMDEWEMDFGEIYLGEVEGKLEFFPVVDRGSSWLVYLEGCSGYCAESALEAVMRLFAQRGLPKRLRFDRDPRLWGSWTRDSYPSPLTRLLWALGVEPIICPPHRPDKKPFVERCIGTLKHEWLARHAPQTLAEALDRLAAFERYYHTQRPHQGRACHNRLPCDAFPRLPALSPLPATVNPNRWLLAEHGHLYRRRVNAGGSIQVDRHTYYVGQAMAGNPVLVQLDGHHACLIVTGDGKPLREFPLKGLYPNSMPLDDYVERLKAEARSIEQYRHFHWQQTGELP
jgi:hypothetical protein